MLQHPRRIFRPCTYAFALFALCLSPFQARIVESTTGMESLNANLFPTMTSLSDHQPPHDSPISSPHSLPSTLITTTSSNQSDVTYPRSSTPTRRSLTVDPTRPTIPSRNVSLAAAVTAKSVKRPSVLTVPPTGRLFKFLGDLFLLAGRCADAGVW